MNGIYKPTVLSTSTLQEDVDANSTNWFAQDLDSTVLSMAKQADVLTEASKIHCSQPDTRYIRDGKPLNFCTCKIEPYFENFRNSVLRLLANVQKDVNSYVQAGPSLKKNEYSVLVEIRDRVDRCQRDIMSFIENITEEYVLRQPSHLSTMNAQLEMRNAKLQTRTNNLLLNELDSDKYLNTVRKQDNDLLKAENIKLLNELKELKTKSEIQLTKTLDLIDKLLTYTNQGRIKTVRTSTSGVRTSNSVQEKMHKRAPTTGVDQFKECLTSNIELQDIKKQLILLREDTRNLQTVTQLDSCRSDFLCPHVKALHNLLNERKQEGNQHSSAVSFEAANYAREFTSTIIQNAELMEKVFKKTMDIASESNNISLNELTKLLRQELADHKEEVQTLRHENSKLLREISEIRGKMREMQQKASSPQQACSHNKMITPNVSVLLQERNMLCEKLHEKDAQLTAMQTEIDEVMAELITLNEKYHQFEKNVLETSVLRSAAKSSAEMKVDSSQISQNNCGQLSTESLKDKDVVEVASLYNSSNIANKRPKSNKNKNNKIKLTTNVQTRN